MVLRVLRVLRVLGVLGAHRVRRVLKAPSLDRKSFCRAARLAGPILPVWFLVAIRPRKEVLGCPVTKA